MKTFKEFMVEANVSDKISNAELRAMHKYATKNPTTILDPQVWTSMKEFENEIGVSSVYDALLTAVHEAAKANKVSPRDILYDYLEGNISLAPTDKADRETKKFYSKK